MTHANSRHGAWRSVGLNKGGSVLTRWDSRDGDQTQGLPKQDTEPSSRVNAGQELGCWETTWLHGTGPWLTRQRGQRVFTFYGALGPHPGGGFCSFAQSALSKYHRLGG